MAKKRDDAAEWEALLAEQEKFLSEQKQDGQQAAASYVRGRAPKVCGDAASASSPPTNRKAPSQFMKVRRAKKKTGDDENIPSAAPAVTSGVRVELHGTTFPDNRKCVWFEN